MVVSSVVSVNVVGTLGYSTQQLGLIRHVKSMDFYKLETLAYFSLPIQTIDRDN